MNTKLVLLACMLAALVFLSFPAAWAKQGEYIIRNNHSIERPQQVDILTLVNRNSIGGALWYSFPLQHTGLLPELNDSLHIEAGLVTSYGSHLHKHNDFVSLTPFGGIRWNFHLTRAWTLFTTAKLGWIIGFDEDYNGLTLTGTVGGIWHFDPQVALRIESGYGGRMAQVGVSFRL